MKNKNKLKNCTIVMMAVLILIQLFSQFFKTRDNNGQLVHEVFGIITFIVIVLHIISNRKWIVGLNKKLAKKTMSKPLTIRFVAAILLALSFISLVATGILMSRTVLVGIGSPRNGQNLVEVHGFFVFLSIALALLHIYLNKNYIMSYLKRRKK
jgi:cytochrome b subunit of formate dehydrogenase